MKKILCLILACILVLSIPMAASASSDANDTINYANGAFDPEDINVLTCTVVDIPDQDVTAASDSDIVLYDINRYSPEDFLMLTPTAINTARTSYIRVEFAGATTGSLYSDFSEHVVSSGGSATLHINTAVWAPEANTLEIGIYNWTTAENWYIEKSGGYISGKTIKFTNLTAGIYSVYIRNLGTNTLTTGYMQYNLT